MQRILICTLIPGEGHAFTAGSADILMSAVVRLQASVAVTRPAPEEAP